MTAMLWIFRRREPGAGLARVPLRAERVGLRDGLRPRAAGRRQDGRRRRARAEHRRAPPRGLDPDLGAGADGRRDQPRDLLRWLADHAHPGAARSSTWTRRTGSPPRRRPRRSCTSRGWASGRRSRRRTRSPRRSWAWVRPSGCRPSGGAWPSNIVGAWVLTFPGAGLVAAAGVRHHHPHHLTPAGATSPTPRLSWPSVPGLAVEYRIGRSDGSDLTPDSTANGGVVRPDARSRPVNRAGIAAPPGPTGLAGPRSVRPCADVVRAPADDLQAEPAQPVLAHLLGDQDAPARPRAGPPPARAAPRRTRSGQSPGSTSSRPSASPTRRVLGPEPVDASDEAAVARRTPRPAASAAGCPRWCSTTNDVRLQPGLAATVDQAAARARPRSAYGQPACQASTSSMRAGLGQPGADRRVRDGDGVGRRQVTQAVGHRPAGAGALPVPPAATTSCGAEVADLDDEVGLPIGGAPVTRRWSASVGQSGRAGRAGP